MPTYVAFLRAINLGATRKFPQADIKRCVEEAGGAEVDTHINTGNVLVTSPIRSRPKLEATLERAFEADRGFAVPTIAFRLAELVEIGADADRFAADLDSPGLRHYVTLLKTEPPAAAVREVERLEHPGERARVSGRAVHVLLTEVGYQSARLSNARVERACGVATTRDAKVIRALVRKWC